MTNADEQQTLGIMQMTTIRFFVPGKPISGGSKRGFVNPRTGAVIITEAAGKANREWRAQVVASCREVFKLAPLEGPLSLKIDFQMPRPQSHYGSGRNKGALKTTAPTHHAIRPDTTKLIRALEDALTHILWKDDAQIVIQSAVKRYADVNPGALVEVTPL